MNAPCLSWTAFTSLAFLFTCATVCVMSVHPTRPGTARQRLLTSIFPALSSVPGTALVQVCHIREHVDRRGTTAPLHRGLEEAETPGLEGLPPGPTFAARGSLLQAHWLSFPVLEGPASAP